MRVGNLALSCLFRLTSFTFPDYGSSLDVPLKLKRFGRLEKYCDFKNVFGSFYLSWGELLEFN